MKIHFRRLFAGLAIAVFFAVSFAALGRDPGAALPTPPPAAPPAAPLRVLGSPPDDAMGSDAESDDEEKSVAPTAPASPQSPPRPVAPPGRLRHFRPRHPQGNGNDQVAVVSSVRVEAGQTVQGDVVAVLGDATVEGTVEGDSVAVLGSNTIDGEVEGNAVAVLGDLTLGPKARVEGDAACVGGHLVKAPGAYVGGRTAQQMSGLHLSSAAPLHAWWLHALRQGRTLAFAPRLSWLWIFNLCLVAFYLLLALVFPRGVQKCGDALVLHPFAAVLSSFVAVLALPLLFVLLLVTVIGIPVAVVLLPLAVGLGVIFGRAAIYSLVGRSLLGTRAHPAVAVLVGALLFILCYLVPFLGLPISLLVSFIGLGCVVATVFSSDKGATIFPLSPAAPGGGHPSASPLAPVVPAGPDATPAPSAASAWGVEPSSSSAAPVSTEATPDPAAPPVLPASAAAETSRVAEASRVPPPLPRPPPIYSSIGLPRAGFWVRMGALAIDGIVVAILLGLIPGHRNGQSVFLPALALYGALLWKLRGSTIGGIIFGLSVVRLDDRPVDWGTAVVRAFACFLSMILIGLGFIWIAFDREKQAWHDKIAGTVVVRAAKAVSLV